MSKHQIITNNISPGFIKTSFYEKFKKDKKKLYNWTISRIPQKRWGEPKEIAELAAFIFSNKSNYLNGETILLMVDGQMRRAVGLIPTRFNSRRLPGKSLKIIGNLPMIIHT